MSLDYIEELGINSGEPTNDGELDNTNGSTKDFDQGSDEKSDNQNDGNTDANKLEEYQSQIEGMEKRIKDKDIYINELKEQSKAKEEDIKKDVEVKEDDFWEDPQARFEEMKSQMNIQQLQLQEAIYANTVDGYFKTVSPDSIKEAVSSDTEFAEKFNNSKEPYRVAFEHLSKLETVKQEAKNNADKEYRDKVRAEILEELKQKPTSRDTVPNINSSGSSISTIKTDSDDGYADIFGKGY